MQALVVMDSGWMGLGSAGAIVDICLKAIEVFVIVIVIVIVVVNCYF